MKTLTVIFLLLINCNIMFSQSGWTVQTSGTTDALFDTYFFDMHTGIVIGGTATNTAVILRTTNAGINWNPVNANTNILLRGVSFISASTGTAVGGNFTSSVILRTTDGGLSWDSINNPTVYALRSVSFPPTGSGNTGYIVGFNGVAMKTSDGGLSWVLLNTGLSTQQLFSVHFTDGVTGTAVGGTQTDTATIIRTTNGGANWIIQNPNTTNLLRGVFFLNSLNGFAVGNNGTILKTTDGGNNWTVFQTNIAGLMLRDIYFVNSVTGFIAGSGGRVMKTTNGGISWDSLSTGINKDLQAVFFLNENFGTSVGFDGAIIHTDSGGVITSNNFYEEEIPGKFLLSQNYPNPFNPTTIISYSINEISFIELKVYDVLGNETAVLINKKHEPGTHKIEFNGNDLPSGIYFYKINVTNLSEERKYEYSEVKKMLLVK